MFYETLCFKQLTTLKGTGKMLIGSVPYLMLITTLLLF